MDPKKFEDFNWEKYESWKGAGLHPNPKIKGQTNNNKCFSHEPYAQEMFDQYNNSTNKFVRKDLEKGDIVPIVEIPYLDETGKMTLEILGGLTIEVDLSREKRFIQLFGFSNIDEFVSALNTVEKRERFVEEGLYAYVIESSPSVKISLWQGYIKKIKDEFMQEIDNPSKAYVCKVLESVRGGFFVEVQGVEAFMPGSLAAPNKIMDFESYVGKEIIVMIEAFLSDMNSFVVSHKKYIEHILPKKISELSFEKKYAGTITGTSKYGIFIEFDEIFTGLLHKSKMKKETYFKFRDREYEAGAEIEFFIGEITKDNRIILTEESLEERKKKIAAFQEKYKDQPIIAEVATVMSFGIIANADGLSGVVPNKEFRRAHTSPKNFLKGETMRLKLLEIRDEDKLVFTFWLEDKKKEEAE